jgi:hypothetical protein
MTVEKLALEMTISKDEFLRRLPGAVGCAFEQVGNEFQGHLGERPWRLHLADMPGTSLGVLKLDRLLVEIELPGFSPGERDEFLSRFRLHYQRGGG